MDSLARGTKKISHFILVVVRGSGPLDSLATAASLSSPTKKSGFQQVVFLCQKQRFSGQLFSHLLCTDGCLLALCSLPMSISSVFLFLFVHTTCIFDLVSKL